MGRKEKKVQWEVVRKGWRRPVQLAVGHGGGGIEVAFGGEVVDGPNMLVGAREL